MRKLTLLPALLSLLSSTATADYGMIGDYGMMSGAGAVGWGLLWLVWFALGAFIFSVIFWLTHNWLSSDKKGEKKKRG